MTGASLEYSGNYVDALLYNVGINSRWHSSTIRATNITYFLSTGTGDNANIFPKDMGNKSYGRVVRCKKPLGKLEASLFR